MKQIISYAAYLVAMLPVAASAQVSVPNPGLPGSSDQTVDTIVFNIIQFWLLPIVGIIAVLFIIVGGFQYILSGANNELAKRGKETLKNAVIGLIIVLLSYVVVTVIVNTLFHP